MESKFYVKNVKIFLINKGTKDYKNLIQDHN